MSLRIELVAALKRLLRAHGMGYAELAQRIGMSEAAVKRMFSQRTLRLERLEAICEVLDIGLSELAAEARRAPSALAELDEATEQALVEDPPLMLALYLTLNRWKESEVLARYTFNRPQWTGLLARLDRLGLIELLPGNRYRVRVARNFRWRRGGPMERFLLRRLPGEFLDRPFHAPNENLILLNGMLSHASARRLSDLLAGIADAFDRMLTEDAALPIGERIGISLLLAERPWTSLRLFDAWQRPLPASR